MSKLTWDSVGERKYETGVRNGVLYKKKSDGTYNKGVAWNGIKTVEENPSGGEAKPLYADDIKYLNLMSNEQFGGKIEAYTYPEEFSECDGLIEVATGVYAGQQSRTEFGFCYRTILGNDTDGENYGYKLHVVYGCLATPTDKSHSSNGEDVEPETMSWTFSTTPVAITKEVNGKTLKPTAHLVFDSTKTIKEKMVALEAILYGSDGTGEGNDARLPLPDEIITLMSNAA